MFKILKKLERKHVTSKGKLMTLVKAECLACGETVVLLLQNVTKSNKEGRERCAKCLPTTFHRLTNTRIWRIWQGLKWRINDPSDKNYGGRGITLCQEWQDFKKFYNDMSEGYSDDLTIERKDVNGP